MGIKTASDFWKEYHGVSGERVWEISPDEVRKGIPAGVGRMSYEDVEGGPGDYGLGFFIGAAVGVVISALAFYILSFW